MGRFEFMHRKSGEIIEREYSIGRAPQRVRQGGRLFERIPSLPVSMHIGDNVNGRSTSFVANSLQPQHAALHRGQFHVNEYGERKPILRNLGEVRELERRTAEAGIPIRHARSL